jgi:hypothetical protein
MIEFKLVDHMFLTHDTYPERNVSLKATLKVFMNETKAFGLYEWNKNLWKSNEDMQFRKLMEVLKQLYINILLVEVIQQIPDYTKFMKDVSHNQKVEIEKIWNCGHDKGMQPTTTKQCPTQNWRIQPLLQFHKPFELFELLIYWSRRSLTWLRG